MDQNDLKDTEGCFSVVWYDLEAEEQKKGIFRELRWNFAEIVINPGLEYHSKTLIVYNNLAHYVYKLLAINTPQKISAPTV